MSEVGGLYIVLGLNYQKKLVQEVLISNIIVHIIQEKKIFFLNIFNLKIQYISLFILHLFIKD